MSDEFVLQLKPGWESWASMPSEKKWELVSTEHNAQAIRMSRNPKFDALIDEIRKLHEEKNHDYAHDTDPLSNLRRAQSLGVEPWRGVLVRLTDKWSRIEQLASGKTPKHESLRDSLIDNAVYSLLAVVLLDEKG